MVNFSNSYNVVMEIEQLIGANIKHYREKAGMTQKTLAVSCGVTPHHIEDVEAGRRKPSIKLLLRIAGAIRVDSGRLLDIGEPVVTDKPLPFKTVLGMYSKIPEGIVKDLASFPEKSTIWKTIEEVIEIEKAANPRDEQG